MGIPNYRSRHVSHRPPRGLANQRTSSDQDSYFHRMVQSLFHHLIPETNRHRRLFFSFRFLVLFIAGAVATFPLFVPPFFLPLYAHSLGFSASAGAGTVAGFNFSSAVGRLGCGFLSDSFGPLNTLFISLLLSALSMLALWPVSNTAAPLIAFVVINGAANGGFFSTMPTVVGSVFGSSRVSVAMGMIVTGWAGGYLMVS